MRRIASLISLLLLLAIVAFADQKYTRGVGIYPGDPAEDYAPALVPDRANSIFGFVG